VLETTQKLRALRQRLRSKAVAKAKEERDKLLAKRD